MLICLFLRIDLPLTRNLTTRNNLCELRNGDFQLMKPERNDCRKLLFLLHERVLHHDFDTAEEIMEAVTSWALLGGEIPIKMTKEVMLQDIDQKEALPEILKVYKQVFVTSHKFKIETMLDIVFLLLFHSDYEEAYQTLLRSVNADPFNGSPLCHGYTGMLAYHFWCKELVNCTAITTVKQETFENDDDTDSIVSGLEVFPKNDSNHCQLVHKHFSQMMKLLSKRSSVSKGQYDHFVYYYWKSLMKMERHKEAFEVLKNYRALYPSLINPCRLLLIHQEIVPKSSNDSIITSARQSLVVTDPSNNEVLVLVQEMIDEGSENYAEAFKLLVNFLDYPHNQQSMNGWRLFRVLTSKWNSYKESPVWIKRSRWWNKLYKDRL